MRIPVINVASCPKQVLTHIHILRGCFLTMLLLSLFSAVCIGSAKDSIPSYEIKKQLRRALTQGLFYPKSVERFYAKNNYQPVWNTNSNNKNLLDAMRLLDSVMQFGLSPAGYHAKERTDARVDMLMDKNSLATEESRAHFDLILTDALLALINHLHFGKLNTVYTNQIIEDAKSPVFSAEIHLAIAMQQNNFISAVLKAQPQTLQYLGVQEYLKKVWAKYPDNYYTLPDEEIRKISVNLERLRWTAGKDSTYLEVNISAYELRFIQPDTAYNFKVIVGKSIHQTPELQSSITHFTTNPDWRIPANIFRNEILPRMIANSKYIDQNHIAVYDASGRFVSPTKINLKKISLKPAAYFARQSAGCDNALGRIIFRFKNSYDIYLHDTPEPQLFNADFRALSHGCIRVENAIKLAELILISEQLNPKLLPMKSAIAAGTTRSFSLVKPLPIKIVYLTCETLGSIFVQYPDVYALDKEMADKLYGKPGPLVVEVPKIQIKP